MNSFPTLLQKFFMERLLRQQHVSPHTISSYRDTFRLLFTFMRDEKEIFTHEISFDHFNKTLILEFLEYLQCKRSNKSRTTNQRLAAIHSFATYLSYECPDIFGQIRQIRSIPYKKTDEKVVDYLTEDEMNLLIQTCDCSNANGRKDRLILLLLYNTGMRVSEMTALKAKDLIDERHVSFMMVMGKGRKQRTIPLWKTTQSALREYLKEHSLHEDQHLFFSSKGSQMTRSGVRYRLDLIVQQAAVQNPELKKKRISPHVLRHTTAMNMLKSGVDLSTIAIWLGHENIDTTHKYMVANTSLKIQALSEMKEPEVNEFCYKPSPDIFNFLNSL